MNNLELTPEEKIDCYRRAKFPTPSAVEHELCLAQVAKVLRLLTEQNEMPVLGNKQIIEAIYNMPEISVERTQLELAAQAQHDADVRFFAAQKQEAVGKERERLLKENLHTAQTIHRGLEEDYRLVTIAISEEEYQALEQGG